MITTLAAAEGKALCQRRGALQGLGTAGVAENPGHPGAWLRLDIHRLPTCRAGDGGTEHAVLMEEER